MKDVIDKIMEASMRARTKYCESLDFPQNPIDRDLDPIPPFWQRNEEVKVILVGQDPTIRNRSKRRNITATLNLDKKGPLRSYVEKIISPLRISFQNIYATNLFKYFYSLPPSESICILESHLPENLKVLLGEIEMFPRASIILLGEPVLQLIAKEHTKDHNRMTYFWNYNFKTKVSDKNFKLLQGRDNHLKRDTFPFPHQPSISKAFYKTTLPAYVDFLRTNNEGIFK